MDDATLGFIGLGVMGGPMCRNLARRSGRPVLAFDPRQPAPDGALAAGSVAEVAQRAGVVFLSLPGETEVREVASEIPPGRFARFADAPVARTRQAAVDGTLSIMVGAAPDFYARIEPLLHCMATDVTHCGPPGAGQAVKLLNNMVLSVTVLALAEALAVARSSGAVEPRVLFETLAKGSADSFALRSHGMQALLPEAHPERAFPTSYMLKDVGYALELARSAGLDLQAAGTARRMLERTVALGLGDAYHTAVLEAVKRQELR